MLVHIRLVNMSKRHVSFPSLFWRERKRKRTTSTRSQSFPYPIFLFPRFKKKSLFQKEERIPRKQSQIRVSLMKKETETSKVQTVNHKHVRE